MTSRWLVVPVVVAALIALPVLAFASPPDPSWLGGWWDDDDFDTVILFITGHSPAIGSPAGGEPTLLPLLVMPLRHRDAEWFPAPPSPAPDCRAPPTV
jgi:hypothetical protein